MCFQGISSNDKTQGTHLILEGRILWVSPGSTGKAGNRPTLINYLEKADIQVGEQETELPFTSAAPLSRPLPASSPPGTGEPLQTCSLTAFIPPALVVAFLHFAFNPFIAHCGCWYFRSPL